MDSHCRRGLVLSLLVVVALTLFSVEPAFARRKKTVKPAEVVRALPAPIGPKKIIAVADFENKAGQYAQWELGTGMSEMLVTSLIASGRFIVVERQEIQRVLGEQDFGQSGRTAGGSAAKIGKILKAQMLIQGAVTEFDSKTSDSGGGFRIKGFLIGSNKATAHVAINIRLYDTTTGQILDSQRCEGNAESGGLTFSYSEADFGFGGSNFQKTPLGKATQQAIDKAVFYIVSRMQNVPWQGSVIKVNDDGRVLINAGSRTGIVPGDVFKIFARGEELIDPDTGESLGYELSMKGSVQLTSPQDVKEKYSVATPMSGTGFERGDEAKYVFK